MLFILSCSKDNTFDGSTLIGEWESTEIIRIGTNLEKLVEVSNVSCNYVFNDNTELYRTCSTIDTFTWYYQEVPQKVILVDKGSLFSNIIEYDFIEYGNTYFKWENKSERVHSSGGNVVSTTYNIKTLEFDRVR